MERMGMVTMSDIVSSSTLPPPNTSRNVLLPESELRIEVPFGVSCTVTLKSGSSIGEGAANGSAEIFGVELPAERPLHLTGTKVAIFTWHGCTLDVTNPEQLDILYVSQETDANIAYVNTHAQLEAMRDEALGVATNAANCESDSNFVEGPRVLLAGPADCGKSSLARVLSAYAVKLGRTPLFVDLDASQNMLSVPGTMAVSPITVDTLSAESNASSTSFITEGTIGSAMPFVLWYGSTDLSAYPDLFKAQLEKMGKVIHTRLVGDVDARASGVIVNTPGWIEDMGYTYLLHAIEAFQINVVLVMGHDRLYSILGTHFAKKTQEEKDKRMLTDSNDASLQHSKVIVPKLIKLPRSGGVVSRDGKFRRASQSQSIKRYFYGDWIHPKKESGSILKVNSTFASPQLQFTPSPIHLPFSDVHLYKISNVSLTASMLPVSAKQSTDPIQLTIIPLSDMTPKLQQSILAVCHPSAVEKYQASGKARDLYLSGVAGFVTVEKVDVEKERLSLLSPCAGSLPSRHLLLGDVHWFK